MRTKLIVCAFMRSMLIEPEPPVHLNTMADDCHPQPQAFTEKQVVVVVVVVVVVLAVLIAVVVVREVHVTVERPLHSGISVTPHPVYEAQIEHPGTGSGHGAIALYS